MKPNTPYATPNRLRQPLVRFADRLSRLLAIAASTALVALALPAQAQTKGTGDIEGRVQNSVTGTAISHAQVSISGTNRTTTTDEAGQYYLGSVPAGTTTLHVTAAGLDPQDAIVNVTAGGIATQDVGLTSKAMYGEGTVKLDAFVVQSSHETNAAAIAINEQRTNPNITSVVASDEFGPRPDQNPGELLKMLPGVDVQYFANNIVGLSVRGLSSNETEIQFDGLQMASMNSESTNRGMEVQYASAADVARIQIRKLPMPEDSANTIGGTINFTRRSAFEYSKLKVSYSGELVSDGEHLTLQDMQGVKDRLTPRWKPNWNVTVTDPVTHNFGFSATVGQNIVDVDTHWSLPSWNYGSLATNQAIAAGGAVGNVPSQFNPAMTQLLNHDAPKEQGKDFASARLDWRPTTTLTTSLEFGGTKGWVQNADDIRYRWRMDQTGSGSPTRYTDPHQNLGRPGGGGIYHDTPLWRDVYSPTEFVQWEARWHRGDWEARTIGGASESRYSYRDTEDGFFGSTTVDNPTGMVAVPQTGVGASTANPIPLTVDFLDTNYWGAKNIVAWTTPAGAAGSTAADTNIADYTVPLDWGSNANTKLGGARSRPASGREILTQEKTWVKRYFNFDNPLSIQLGFDWSERYRTRQYDYNAWRFVGPDATTSQISAVALQARPDFEYNDPGSQRISMTRYYKMYQDHPEWFQYDAARSLYLSRTSQPKYKLWEKIPAGYAEFEWHLLHNRLTVAGGLRYERVEDDATGLLSNFSAAYMHYANGQVVHAGDLDASGKAMVANLGTSTAVNYQLVNAPNVLPSKISGAPIFLPYIQQAGNLQYANSHVGPNGAAQLNTDPNYSGGFTNDTGTNLGRTSMAYYQAVYLPSGARAKGMNDGYFPDLNASYNIAPNLQFQIGYAKTQARLDYNNVLIPGTTRDENPTSSGASGTITMHNTDLKPWRADNFDARLTWYNTSNSYFGIGAFTKRIHNTIVSLTLQNLSADDVAALDAAYPNLNLGADAVGYDFKVDENQGNSRLDGAEFEMRQSLDPLIGRWVPGFRLYATSTYTQPQGPISNSAFSHIRWHDKVGLSYSHGRWEANVNWTHTGLQIDKTISNTALLSPNGYQVELSQNLVDVSLTFAINHWAKIWLGGTDVTDERRARETRYPGLSGYGTMTSSNTFGKTYFIGVTGNF